MYYDIVYITFIGQNYESTDEIVDERLIKKD